MLCYSKKRNQMNTPKEGEAGILTHTPQGPSWQCTGRAPWYPGRDLVEGGPRARQAASAQLTLGMGETRQG